MDREGMSEPVISVEDLLAKSSKTDTQVLIAAKERLKRAVAQSPTNADLAALKRVEKMLDEKSANSLRDWRAVLAYVEESGRKLKKSKMYEDIRKGLLKKQADGTFRLRDVDRYAASLPFAATPDRMAEKAASLQRTKEEQEIRRISAIADKEEFLLAVKKGQFIPREQVHLELAARAVTLASGLKTALEARGLDIISLVEGNPRRAQELSLFLEKVLDEAMNEYASPLELTVEFSEVEQVTGEDDA